MTTTAYKRFHMTSILLMSLEYYISNITANLDL